MISPPTYPLCNLSDEGTKGKQPALPEGVETAVIASAMAAPISTPLLNLPLRLRMHHRRSQLRKRLL
jgi:hypothetical protein